MVLYNILLLLREQNQCKIYMKITQIFCLTPKAFITMLPFSHAGVLPLTLAMGRVNNCTCTDTDPFEN